MAIRPAMMPLPVHSPTPKCAIVSIVNPRSIRYGCAGSRDFIGHFRGGLTFAVSGVVSRAVVLTSWGSSCGAAGASAVADDGPGSAAGALPSLVLAIGRVCWHAAAGSSAPAVVVMEAVAVAAPDPTAVRRPPLARSNGS